MYKQSSSRPALLSSLNFCVVDKPAEERFGRFFDGGYCSGKEIFSSLVPLFIFHSRTFDGLDKSEQLIALYTLSPFQKGSSRYILSAKIVFPAIAETHSRLNTDRSFYYAKDRTI